MQLAGTGGGLGAEGGHQPAPASGEHGDVAMAAVAVPGGLPLLIELGVAFDLIVLITVATAFHQRIFGEFGTGDTGVLRDLHE